MTSPDKLNPESAPESIDEIQNSAPAGTPEPAGISESDHSGEGNRLRSHPATQAAERVARTAADNARAAVNRAWQAIEPLITAAIEWLRGGKDAGKHRAGMHPRMRTVQISSLAVAAGMLGLVVSSFGQGQLPSQQSGVQDAAQIASLPLTQTPKKQDVPELKSIPGPSAESAPETKSDPAPETNTEPAGIPAKGIDVSNHNGAIDWDKVASGGQHFAFILATDGDDFSSSSFEKQYEGAKKAGLMAGAYHFGRPSGSADSQADRLLKTANYQADGKTLPPVLDLEPDPNGSGCYGKSPAAMNDWIKTFANKVKQGTGKDPIIYASTGFWSKCTGNTDKFKDMPLWLASYGVDNPKIPSGWDKYTFWQYSDSGSIPGISGQVDVNKFGGDTRDLKKLAAK